MDFKKQEVAPPHNDEFYYSDKNVFHRCGYGMPNCTCYAHGRFASLTGKFLPLYHNANTWFEEAQERGFPTGTVPRLGAIACWDSDGAGHVAIVEAILSNGNIITSNSAWKGTEFYLETHYYKNTYNWTSKKTGKKYTFQGFIYPSIFFREPTRCVQATAKTALRSLPSKKSELKRYIAKTELCLYEGIYSVAEGKKWLYVKTIETFLPLQDTRKASYGWILDADVKDFAPVVNTNNLNGLK